MNPQAYQHLRFPKRKGRSYCCAGKQGPVAWLHKQRHFGILAEVRADCVSGEKRRKVSAR
jgi:hypothetical protein